jgi:GTP-binding protein
MQITAANYIGSYTKSKACPEFKLPEYAFVGRSNVGKSSLINLLCDRKDLASVSNQPGKTQTINLYDIDGEWVLADLPGYGYAKVAKTKRHTFKGMISDYLMHRQNLVCVFVLLDFRLPLQAPDRAFMAMLGEQRIPFTIIYTKVDKVSPQQRPRHANAIEEALLEDWASLPERIHTSSSTREGRDTLLEYISEINVRTAGI